MQDATSQIQSILQMIKHKKDVSVWSTLKEYHLDVFELGKLDDYAEIMDKLDEEFKVIKIWRKPDFGGPELDPMSMEDFQLDAIVKTHLTYDFTIKTSFDKFYLDHSSSSRLQIISADDVTIHWEDYNPRSGTLTVGDRFKVPIARQGKSTGTINVDTEQCKLMKMLFQNDSILRKGFTVHYFLKIKSDQPIDAKKVKSVKNIVTEINFKFKEVTGLEKLIKFKRNRISINEIYLLKD